MYSLEIREGRLIELRIASPVTMAEVGAFARQLRELLGSVTGQVVICTELLGANIFPPDVADAFNTIMKSDNPRIERSAFLVGASATFGLQIERLIRDAGNPARRTFRDVAQLAPWLHEVLGPRERSRLDAFLTAPRREA